MIVIPCVALSWGFKTLYKLLRGKCDHRAFADKLVREVVQIGFNFRGVGIEFGFRLHRGHPSAPHPNRKVCVLPLAVGRHGDFEDAGGMIPDVAEEEIAVVIDGASRNVMRQAGGMLEPSDLLSLESLRIEAPDDAFVLLTR